MTLTVSIATRDSIWTLADRQSADDNADGGKIVGIDATDGHALVAFAGHSAVADRAPSQWIASIVEGVQSDLRGYMTNLTEAANAQLPAQARRGHILVAAAIAGGEPLYFSVVGDASGQLTLRCFERSGAFMLAGSGAAVVLANKDRANTEARELQDWIRRVEMQEAPAREVTDRLIKWNTDARREDKAVGARAIISYRFARDADGAAGRCFYNGTKLEAPDAKVPHLTRGVDVNKIFDIMKKQAMGSALSPREIAALRAYKKGADG